MKLLPCPFCGAKQSVNIGATGVWVFPYRDIISGKIIKWGVQCSDCFSESRASFKKDVAINNWNHRAAPMNIYCLAKHKGACLTENNPGCRPKSCLMKGQNAPASN